MREILRQHSFSVTFLLVLFGFFFLFPGDDDGIYHLPGLTMGTIYDLQLTELPAQFTQRELAAEVAQILRRLDLELFSTYAGQSELSRLNRSEIGTPVPVAPELIEVMLLADDIHSLSGGAFDVTVGSLVSLWGFGPGAQQLNPAAPSQDEIDLLLSQIGHEHLIIDQSQSQITRTADVFVDLSGIAKGYAVDVLADYFDSLQITDYFLEVGGELKIRGLKADGASWVPAIEKPVDTAPQIYEIFYTNGEEIAVAGSGDYRNYFEQDGVRYSHEIDPRTGRPVTHNLAAVYVIDESVARADALATAFMVMGFDAAKALAERENQAVYLIYRSESEEFAEYFTESFSAFLDEG
ncbi:MAG: FAD:protein FMN transferase [Gammaproteobacteria bacterium]|jgi:thiamine biosynthesis lipoprotein|nr:FAD:protein FMN transferase [Gammaproteobacteria bacterium]